MGRARNKHFWTALILALGLAAQGAAQEGSAAPDAELLNLNQDLPYLSSAPIPRPRGMPPARERPLVARSAVQGTPSPSETTPFPGVASLGPAVEPIVRTPLRPSLSPEEAAEQEARRIRWQEERASRIHRAPVEDIARGRALGLQPVAPITPPETSLLAVAVVRELDKMTGQTRTFEMPIGQPTMAGRLRVQVEACRAPDGGGAHGTMVFVKVWDMKAPEAEVFAGWMFAESPALSAMDHPRYDLWVISCMTSAGAASAARE